LKGWRFRTDPENSGHLLKQPYYLEKFPDGGWAPIAIGDVWENQGFKGYDGFAWYRLKFTLPKEIPGKATELCFGAVDECAWVWLNGVFIGQHDEGPKGWSTPFRLEVTKEVRWGAENTLVVRVEDSEQAGGIWKPVVLEVLK
jgi:sialate O-acetylesterase